MIIFERETKTLIIPEGLGTESGDGGYNEGFEAGKTAQKAIDDAKITPTTTITENGSYEAPYGFKEVVVNVPSDGDCQEEIDAAYDEGKADGIAEQKAKLTSTEITANGTYESEDGFNRVRVNVESAPQLEIRSYNLDENWSGESGEVYPNTSLGYDGFRYFYVNDIGYGQKKYDDGYTAGETAGEAAGEAAGIAAQKAKLTSTTITANGTYNREDGWNQIEVAVPQEGDCTEAYNQGYSDGIGETASVYIQIKSFYATLTLINREIEVNGDSFHYTGAKGYELLPGNNLIILAYEGKLPDKYVTPTSVSFTILTSDIEAWNGGSDNWYVEEVKFNGLVDSLHSSYTGGFNVRLGNWTVTQVDSTTSKITINLN